MMPKLYTDGLLVAGDAAAMCLAAGLWLEGVNYAMGSAMAAAGTAAMAVDADDVSARNLHCYQKALEASWVLQDHRKVRRAAHFLLSDRVQDRYPRLACDLFEQLYTVENPKPKRGALTILRPLRKKHGIGFRDLAKDGRDAGSIFG